MAKQSDWLPASRQEQLDMAVNWINVLQTQTGGAGGAVSNAQRWGMPAGAVSELTALVADADSALSEGKREETRTPVVTARCKTAFDGLIAKMRDIKKRYFYVPPLAEADIIALGLKMPDTKPTMTGVPTAQTGVETYLVGRHQLGIKIVYVSGNPDDPANKGYRVWYSVIAHGEVPPVNPGELGESFSTKRKKDVIDFAYGDSGKTVYIAVQVENGKEKGPWGPLVSALIP